MLSHAYQISYHVKMFLRCLQIHRKQRKASEMIRWEEGKWICKMQTPFVGIEEKTIEIASSCWKTFEIGRHLEPHTEGQFKANWIFVQRKVKRKKENEKWKWTGKVERKGKVEMEKQKWIGKVKRKRRSEKEKWEAVSWKSIQKANSKPIELLCRGKVKIKGKVKRESESEKGKWEVFGSSYWTPIQSQFDCCAKKKLKVKVKVKRESEQWKCKVKKWKWKAEVKGKVKVKSERERQLEARTEGQFKANWIELCIEGCFNWIVVHWINSLSGINTKWVAFSSYYEQKMRNVKIYFDLAVKLSTDSRIEANFM